jgi:uncharacterized protein involved in type VI secretion and phage assembly
MSARTQFYGKYRGVITDNKDPWMMGRVRAKVPDVLGNNDSGWAMPCVPYAGKNVGLFLTPPINASVWIEFEHGDPDHPVWTGCFWAKGETPANTASADMKVLKTDSCTITLNDTSGNQGVTIETTAGMKIKLDQSGIEINDGQGGKIKLSATQVSVNDGALEIT